MTSGYYNDDKPKEKKYRVKYNSNNSGGSWWLKDEDWKALEKAGWKVWWYKNEPEHSDRWLGALATNAEKEFDSLEEAFTEFENVTGQSVTDSGCSCCGEPHNFSWIDNKGEHDFCTEDQVLDLLAKTETKDQQLARLRRGRY